MKTIMDKKSCRGDPMSYQSKKYRLRLALGSAWLFLAAGMMARADVNYDVVQSAKWPPPQIDATVHWTDAGVFAMSPKLYAPVLEGTAQEVTHVHIKDRNLFAVDAKIRRIYDLDARTLTTVNLEARTYAVESFDAAFQRYRQAAAQRMDRDFLVSAQKTGKTVHLYDLDATEYSIVATRKRFGRNKVTARLLCWIADHSWSVELDDFRKMWSARTSMPFLGDVLPSNGASEAYVAMVRAQASIPGYVLGFVTEARSAESQIDREGRPSSVYDASHNHLPYVHYASGDRDAASGFIYDPFVHLPANNRLIQLNLLNFTNNAVDPTAFVIPSSFKQSNRSVDREIISSWRNASEHHR
jgi:hypothetical protein